MNDVVRIVALGDTHGFESDLPPLPDGDVLVHVGDACRGGTIQELDDALAFLAAQRHGQKIFVAGNHDRCLERAPARARARFPSTIRYVEDELVTVCGLRWFCSPWTPVFHDWSFMAARGPAIAAKWAAIPDDVDVLVTHGPPAGILDASTRAGCADLGARVRAARPLLHVFGHIHQGRGVVVEDEVTFVNATTNECDYPAMVIDVDRARRVVSVNAG